jgi:hypothetical protein
MKAILPESCPAIDPESIFAFMGLRREEIAFREGATARQRLRNFFSPFFL